MSDFFSACRLRKNRENSYGSRSEALDPGYPRAWRYGKLFFIILFSLRNFPQTGKSPVIIDSKCDIKSTGKRLLWGKVANAGQTCIAPDYVLVPRDFQDELVKELEKW